MVWHTDCCRLEPNISSALQLCWVRMRFRIPGCLTQMAYTNLTKHFVSVQYGLVHISVGDLLREEVKQGTPAGLKAKSFMESGNLVPDSVVVEMVKTRLDQDDVKSAGWLLDGYPRCVGAAGCTCSPPRAAAASSPCMCCAHHQLASSLLWISSSLLAPSWSPSVRGHCRLHLFQCLVQQLLPTLHLHPVSTMHITRAAPDTKFPAHADGLRRVANCAAPDMAVHQLVAAAQKTSAAA